MLRYLLVVAALGGCLYEEKTLSPPFGCLQDPAASTTKQSSVISGVMQDANARTPISGVSVELLNDTHSSVDGPMSSAGDGGFRLVLPLGGAPFLRTYLKAEVAGYVLTYAANARPVVDDLFVPYGIVSVGDASGVAIGTIGETQFAAETGTMFINVRDCNDDPVAGATITSVPPLRVFYFQGFNPSSVPTSTTEAGVALIADLTEPMVTVNVSVGDVTYRPQTYKVEHDAFTQVDITP